MDLDIKVSKNFIKKIKDFGWNNIKHVIVQEKLTASEAQNLERTLIKEYKDAGLSYNEDDGGGLGGNSWVKIEYNGNMYLAQELANISNISGITGHDITTMINHHGWSVEKAITKPKMKKDYKFKYGDNMYTVKELLEFRKDDSITYDALRDRLLNHNWDIERALSQPTNVKMQPKGVGDKIYKYNGKFYNSYELSQMSNVEGITPFDITNRINHHGWSVEKAITKPKKKINQKFEYKGNLYSSKELAEIAKKNGLNNIEYHDITDRIRGGWSVEEAVTKPKQKKRRT